MSEFKRTRPEGCLSDLQIDRWLRDELAAGAVDEARRHVESCALCRERVDAIEALRAAHRAAPPPLARPVRRWRAWSGAGAAVAAAAALLLLLRPVDEGTRVKGGAGAALFVQHAGQVRPAQPGERVAPGDTLQFVYTSVTPIYGAILSVDGAQHVSRYFPDEPRAAALEPGTARPFPRSTVLDETPGRELLYVLLCKDAIALGPVEAALAAGPPHPSACRVERFEIGKPGP